MDPGRIESPTTSSFGDTFDALDVALADMTKELLPGYYNQIQNADCSELEPMIIKFAAEAISKQFKDKDLTKTLGKLSLVVTTKLKLAHKLLAQALDKMVGKMERCSQLQI